MLVALREGRSAGREALEWAGQLVLYDCHGAPLRDADDNDDDEALKPSGVLLATPQDYLDAHTLRGLRLRHDELIYAVISTSDALTGRRDLYDRTICPPGMWLKPPTGHAAVGGHQLSFSKECL